MPYIQRDDSGTIMSLTREGNPGQEFLSADAPEILAFLGSAGNNTLSPDDDGLLGLQKADQELIRVIEDIIDLLIAKNILMFSDLPLPVQRKLLQKRGERERLFGQGGHLLTDEGGIL